MASKLLAAQAVVLGAGMAGLAAARVLADCFERVTVLERDTSRPTRLTDPEHRSRGMCMPCLVAASGHSVTSFLELNTTWHEPERCLFGSVSTCAPRRRVTILFPAAISAGLHTRCPGH